MRKTLGLFIVLFIGIFSGCVDSKSKPEVEKIVATETTIASTAKSTEISKVFKIGNLLPSSILEIEYTDEISIKNGDPAFCCPPKNDFERAEFDIKGIYNNIRVTRSRDRSSFINWEFGARNSFKIKPYEGFNIYIPKYYYSGIDESYTLYTKEDVSSYVEIEGYIIVGRPSNLQEIIDFYKRGDVLNKNKVFNEMLSEALKYTDGINKLVYSKNPLRLHCERIFTKNITEICLAELNIYDYSSGMVWIDVYKFSNESEAKKFATKYKEEIDKRFEKTPTSEIDKGDIDFNLKGEIVVVIWKFKEK